MALLLAAGSILATRLGSAGIREPWLERLSRRVRAEHIDAFVSRAEVIFRGRDGWTFHALHDAWSCERPRHEDLIQDSLADLALSVRIIRATGRPLLVALVPTKAEVYADRLGPRLERFLTCHAPFLARVRRAVRRTPGSLIVADAMAAARRAGDERLYYRDDTHWTPRGAWMLTRSIVNGFAPDLIEPDDLRDLGSITHVGDNVRTMGSARTEQVNDLRVLRGGATATLTGSEFLKPRERGSQPRRHWRTGHDERAKVMGGTTLFLIDSFGRAVARQLAPYTEELDEMHWLAPETSQLVEAVTGASRVVMQFISYFAVLAFRDVHPDLPLHLAVGLREELRSHTVELSTRPARVGSTGAHILVTRDPLDGLLVRRTDGDWTDIRVVATEPGARVGAGWRAAVLPDGPLEVRTRERVTARILEIP
jgi:hypothetical protein